MRVTAKTAVAQPMRGLEISMNKRAAPRAAVVRFTRKAGTHRPRRQERRAHECAIRVTQNAE